MKSYIKFLALGAVVAATSACTDLDTPVDGYYVQYPDSPEAIEAKLNGCFGQFQESLRRDYKELVVLASDEFVPVSFGGDYAESRYYNSYLHKSTPDEANAEGAFSNLSQGIVYTNQLLDDMGDGNPKVKAQLRAIRAFYHFILMDTYGDVPISDRVFGKSDVVARRPRAEVAKWIESELLPIMNDLPEENNDETYGTPNKWMAKALLAKLYLNWGVYTNPITSVDNNTANPKLNDCVKICDEITESTLFEVGTGYRKKFFPDNGVHIKDFIYATHYTVDNGHDWDRYFQFRQNKGDYVSYWGFVLTNSCGGNIRVNPEMVDILQAIPNDERTLTVLGGPVCLFDDNFDRTSEPFMYKGEQVVMSKEINVLEPATSELNVGKNVAGWTSGYECVKYPINSSYNTHSRRQTNDIPIFRYADILLTKAECILRGATATKGDTPEGLVNQVRDCAGADHCTTIDLNGLLDERGRELFAEIWRRNDLIRFGQYEKPRPYWAEVNPNALTDKRMRLMPLPRKVLQTNKSWSQNEGY